jgi:hypothetical protein
MPFEGRTGFEISSAILREMPNPLGPPVPPGLWGIIQRCMAKEPMQRSGNIGRGVVGALDSLISTAGTRKFSSETKTSDVLADSRVRSAPDPRSRSSLPSVVTETPST